LLERVKKGRQGGDLVSNGENGIRGRFLSGIEVGRVKKKVSQKVERKGM